jgi:YidC/Oxa1 family membrane protein insertase
LVFQVVQAQVFVMTLPDLNRYHLKRSFHHVHYVYMFHSILSTHMTYRPGAFDAYDTILCVGPHHLQELRKTRDLYSRPKATLVQCGHPRLDNLVSAAKRRRDDHSGIVVAPTWGPSSFIEQPWGQEVVEVLLTLQRPTTLRLHPMTVRHHPDLPMRYKEQLIHNPYFSVQTDISDIEELLGADALVTDWSGAGLEFILATGRRAIFIDTPRKVNNPDYQAIGCRPLELVIREDLGCPISPAAIDRLPDLIRHGSTKETESRVECFRDSWIYNNGVSARVAAEYIYSLLC